MPFLKRSNLVLGFLLTVAIVIVAVSGMGLSLSSGIDTPTAENAGANLEVGATCHSPIASPEVTAVLEGVPGNYTMPNEIGGEYTQQTYNLTVTIIGGPEVTADAMNAGGFNLLATAGTLEATDDSVQIMDSGEATHTATGNDQRTWNLTWTSPAEPGEAVLFRLTVNAVNGNGAADPDDQWNRADLVSEGLHGAAVGGAAGEEAIHVETLGVNWLAYWVGIASFVFMIGLMVVYYFVFRYAESSHVTDHRARKEKNK